LKIINGAKSPVYYIKNFSTNDSSVFDRFSSIAADFSVFLAVSNYFADESEISEISSAIAPCSSEVAVRF